MQPLTIEQLLKDAKTYYLLKPSALLQKLNIFNCIPFISITISKAWILTYCKLFYNCIFTTPFFNRFTLIFILVPVLQITSLIWIIFKQWKKKLHRCQSVRWQVCDKKECMHVLFSQSKGFARTFFATLGHTSKNIMKAIGP